MRIKAEGANSSVFFVDGEVLKVWWGADCHLIGQFPKMRGWAGRTTETIGTDLGVPSAYWR